MLWGSTLRTYGQHPLAHLPKFGALSCVCMWVQMTEPQTSARHMWCESAAAQRMSQDSSALWRTQGRQAPPRRHALPREPPQCITPADIDLALHSSAPPSLGSPGGRRWTNAASSRAGTVGRVQSITKAFIVQACIGLDRCVACTRLHAPPRCYGMIATFIHSSILECNPDARNVGRAISKLVLASACILQTESADPDPHTDWLSAAHLHHRKTSIAAINGLMRHLAPAHPMHRWSVSNPLLAVLRSTAPTNQLIRFFKWVPAMRSRAPQAHPATVQ